MGLFKVFCVLGFSCLRDLRDFGCLVGRGKMFFFFISSFV